jgi:hypothetical protein
MGVMLAQTARDSTLWLAMHRVVEDQVTCHNGCLGTPDGLQPFCLETIMFGLDQAFQTLPETQ